MRVLLTNDDGIEAEGIQALRMALQRLDGIELAAVEAAAGQLPERLPRGKDVELACRGV